MNCLGFRVVHKSSHICSYKIQYLGIDHELFSSGNLFENPLMREETNFSWYQNIMNTIFSCIVFILIIKGSTKAQPVASDTLSSLIEYPVSIYYQSLGEQSPLYNGSEFVDYGAKIHIGHPFYKTTDFVKGTIHFDGMVFGNAMMLYDIIKDKIIIQHFDKIYRIEIPVKKIEKFAILGHTFIPLLPDSGQVIEEGFYDRLYSGKISLFAKRKKLIREDRNGTEINNVVDEKNFFYILKQNVYYPIKNQRALLNLLKDKSDQIRKLLRTNGIKFRKDPERAILLGVEFYDRPSS